jgi:hypothetical protein
LQVLAGNNQNESTVFRANGLSYFNGVYPINQTYFDQFISNAAQFGPNFPSVVNQLYPASSYPTVFARLAAIEGDRDYTCQVRHYVDLMNEAGASDLYVYELRRALPYTNPQTFLGSFHSTDVRCPVIHHVPCDCVSQSCTLPHASPHTHAHVTVELRFRHVVHQRLLALRPAHLPHRHRPPVLGGGQRRLPALAPGHDRVGQLPLVRDQKLHSSA